MSASWQKRTKRTAKVLLFSELTKLFSEKMHFSALFG